MVNSELNYFEVINKNNDGIFIITKDDCPLCNSLKQLFDTINMVAAYQIFMKQRMN